MARSTTKLVFFIGLFGVLQACEPSKGQYEQLVQRELESGVRNDSLFLGIHFGMSRFDFFEHCWKLNKQRVLNNGPGNLSVEYKMDTLLKYPAFMRFYPGWQDNGISIMPVEFTYEAWAPWNKERSADSLLMDVIDLYQRWYGADFLKMEQEGRKDSWVQIMGNRRLIVLKKDTATVSARYDDLLVTNSLLKKQNDE